MNVHRPHRTIGALLVAAAFAGAGLPAGASPPDAAVPRSAAVTTTDGPDSTDDSGTRERYEVHDHRWPDTADGVARADDLTRRVTDAGGTVLHATPTGLVLAELTDDARRALAGQPSITVRAPFELDVTPLPPDGAPTVRLASTPDHVRVTGADAWHAAGRTGRGVRVGVIDVFHVPTFWDTTTMGPRPVSGTTARCWDRGRDCTSEFFTGTARPGDDHGPAVVEVIRSMAPEAEILIARASTESDYYAVVDWFLANGVTIVNRSLGSRFDGPGDGSGVLTSVANYAGDRGIVWVNSAGNNADGRYYRHPVRLVGDRVAFGPSGTDTWLRFTGCVTPGGVRWAGDWALPPAQRTDYDVFLHDAPIGSPASGRVIASSTLRQRNGAPPLEVITGSRCPAPGRAFYLEVRRVAGTPEGDVLEIIDFADGIAAHTQARYSAAVPVVDSRHPAVLGVGAVDPPLGGRVAAYSSQGPTNDGRIVPDLVAPAGADSVTFGETFSGTSASAPVVAGAAALLREARITADARSLADLIRHSVVDRGPRGRDLVHGTGELRLPAPPRGITPAAPASYVPLPAPTRILDTRPSSAVGPANLIGDRWPGRIVDLPVGSIPGIAVARVTAVAANVTLVDSTQPGFVQAFPTGAATLGGFSNLNADAPGQTRPNFSIIPVSPDGRFSVYSTTGGDLVVDVLGVFEESADPTRAGRLVSLPSARRVLDTRDLGRRVRTGEQATIPLPTGVDPREVAALVVNVTATETIGTGYVQALPFGRDRDIGQTSTLNLVTGLTVANTVIVPAEARGARLYAQLGVGGSVHLIADVTGYITSDAAPASTRGRFVAVRPGRSLDTRRTGPILGARSTVDVSGRSTPGVTLPSGVSSVAWNLTVTGTVAPGYLRAWPAGAAEPPTSAINWIAPGATLANAAIVAPNADGVLRIRGNPGVPLTTGWPLTHVVVDLFGYFT